MEMNGRDEKARELLQDDGIDFLYTHEKPDIDAFLSLVAVRRYVPGAKNARIVLRPAAWDGNGMGPKDIAVDVEAGGRGWKGELDADGKRHSCFAMLMLQCAPTEHQYLLRHLIAYVDTGDSKGNAVKALIPEASQKARDTLDAGGIAVFIASLQRFHGDEDSATERIVRRLEEYFEGMLIYWRHCAKAEAEADNAELFADGKVALVINGGRSVTSNLYSRGVRIVVFKNGYGTGVTREQTEKVRMDDPRFIAVVEAAGEKVDRQGGPGKYFAHPDGFLLASGTPKSKTTFSSKVDPRDFVRVAVEILAEYDAAKETAT